MGAINPLTPADLAAQVDQICQLTSMTAKLTAMAEARMEVLTAYLAEGANTDALMGLLFSINRQVAELDERAWKLADGIEGMRGARATTAA